MLSRSRQSGTGAGDGCECANGARSTQAGQQPLYPSSTGIRDAASKYSFSFADFVSIPAKLRFPATCKKLQPAAKPKKLRIPVVFYPAFPLFPVGGAFF